jgi:hypothetical protein
MVRGELFLSSKVDVKRLLTDCARLVRKKYFIFSSVYGIRRKTAMRYVSRHNRTQLETNTVVKLATKHAQHFISVITVINTPQFSMKQLLFFIIKD